MSYSTDINCSCDEAAVSYLPQDGEFVCQNHADESYDEGLTVLSITTEHRRNNVLESVRSMWPEGYFVEIPEILPRYVVVEEDSRGGSGNGLVFGNDTSALLEGAGDSPEFPPVELVNLDTGEKWSIEAQYVAIGFNS